MVDEVGQVVTPGAGRALCGASVVLDDGRSWGGAAVARAGFVEFGDESEEQPGGGASGLLNGVVEFVDPEQKFF